MESNRIRSLSSVVPPPDESRHTQDLTKAPTEAQAGRRVRSGRWTQIARKAVRSRQLLRAPAPARSRERRRADPGRAGAGTATRHDGDIRHTPGRSTTSGLRFNAVTLRINAVFLQSNEKRSEARS